MSKRPQAQPARAGASRPNPPAPDDPVTLPDMPTGETRAALEKAHELGASPRRLAWACMAVAELMARRMEEARLLDDDRPEAIIASMRRWCLHDAPEETPVEAAAESRVALSAVEVDGPKEGQAARRARWFFAAGLDGLVDWCRTRFFGGRLGHVMFTAAMLDAKGVLKATGDSDAEAESLVFYAFADALAEPMGERRDNPGDRAGRRTDLPVEVPPMPGEVRRAMEEAIGRGASTRRLAWACLAVADLLVRSVDRARWLEDDRPEAMIARMRRWCLREEDDEAVREVEAEARDARVELSDAYMRASARAEKARYFLALALETLVGWVWQRYTGGTEDATFAAGMLDAAAALRYTGETRREAEGLVAAAFSAGLADPMPERRDNPRARDPLSILPRFLRSTDVAAWRWALKHVALDFDSKRDYRERAPEYRERAFTYALRARKIAREGSVEICRAIAIPHGTPWREAVRFDCLGKAWSAERCGAGVYGMVPYDGPTREIHLVGRVAAADVDWAYGFESFLIYGEEQWEISLLNHVPVTVTEVDGEVLKTPIVGSSGTAGEYWAHTCHPRVDNPRASSPRTPRRRGEDSGSPPPPPRARRVPTPLPLPAGFRLVLGAAAGDLFMVMLVRDGLGDGGSTYDSIAGYVKVRELPLGDGAWSACAAQRAEVERAAGVKGLRALYVSGSWLDGELRQQGLGAVLYAAATAVAASDHHAALMANNCASERRLTSGLAERVWKSRRFAEVAYVFGEVAYPKPTSERQRVDNPARGASARAIPTPLPLPAGVTVAVEPAQYGLFTIVARRQGLDGYAGSITASAWSEPPLWTTCHADKRRVAKLARKRDLRLCYVSNSSVHPSLRNTGLGVALYAAAIALAARDHGAGLMSNSCVDGRSQKTSPEAARVWKSRRLAEVAFVSGQVAYARPIPKPPKPLWRMTRAEFEQALEDDGQVTHAAGVYRRLGPTDPPRGERTPGVDFYEPDHQDASDRVDEDTVRRDYGDGRAELDVYQAWVPDADMPSPQLAEEISAVEEARECRKRQRALGYPDEGEEGYEDCDAIEEGADGSYDWDSLRMSRSTPPAKVLVEADGRASLLDGNHRVTWWGERGFASHPAWVLDATGHRAAVVAAVKRGERVPLRVLADYPDIPRTRGPRRS